MTYDAKQDIIDNREKSNVDHTGIKIEEDDVKS